MNNEEAKEKFNAINNRSREKLGEIIGIASKACVDSVHPGGYEPGQYGQDYRTLGAAIAKIRQICKKDLSGDFPDYEWMAGMMMHDEFKPERLAQEIEALALVKPVDYPTFFTPGWLVEIAKWLAANGTASGQQQGKPTDDELHEAATEEPTDKVKVEGEGEQRKSTSTVHLNSSPSPVFPTLPSGADGTPAAAGKAPNNLDFCRMRMQVFGGKGSETKFIGKRTNLDTTNPVQIFEITVKRPNGTFGSVATATENGELLFRLESQARFSITNTMSVKCLRALLLCREKDNRKRHRLSKRKRAAAAKATASGEVA